MVRRFALILMGIAALTSCEHKELCFDHEPHAMKYHALVDPTWDLRWEQDGLKWQSEWPDTLGMTYESLNPSVPDGLRMLTYEADGTYSITNLPADGGEVQFTKGEHSLTFYNNDTEYIVFDDLASYASAKATTRTRLRSSYVGNSLTDSKADNTVAPPDMLFGHYIPSYTPEKAVEADYMPVTMRPLVFTYLIRFEFSHGLEYVSLARGELAGMAEAVYLNSGKTSEEDATLLYDCTVESFGAQAIVRSFGIPGYPNPSYTKADKKYGLSLEVRLKNGKTLPHYEFDVTDQVTSQPHGGVIIVKGLEVSDKDGKEGSSGFIVDVDDWGEYKDIDLEL